MYILWAALGMILALGFTVTSRPAPGPLATPTSASVLGMGL